MLIPPNEHHLLFLKLLRNRPSKGRVIVFASYDCDSICACHILTHLFKTEHTKFTVFPVRGYEDLKYRFEQVRKEKDKPGAFVFINNGGTVDLTDYLEAGYLDKIDFLVFDTHRPFDLVNVNSARDHIKVFGNADDLAMEYPQDSNVHDEDTSDETLRKLLSYYSGTYYAVSTSYLIYKIARKLSKANNNILWFALVGLCEQFMNKKIRSETYTSIVSELQREVLRYNVPNLLATGNKRLNSVPVGHIEFCRELRFLLYRHWNLFESIFYCDYVASKFLIWKEKGRKKLLNFFAKMSIPVNECKRPFASLSHETRKNFLNCIERLAKKFRLSELYLGSFVRKNDQKSVFSCMETVAVLNALLSATTETVTPRSQQETLINDFWNAYDSLAANNATVVKRGVDLAQKTWRAIIRQGVQIMERKSFVLSGPFRQVVVEQALDCVLVASVQNLWSLALFLASALEAATRQSGSALVLSVLDKEKSTFAVIGVPSAVGGNLERNSFGRAFREAADKMECRYRQDEFDSNFLEIQKQDHMKFMDYLHSGMVEI